MVNSALSIGIMDTTKLLKTVGRLRSAIAGMDLELAEIQQQLEASQVPAPERKRRNLKKRRVEEIGRMYATGKFRAI